MEIYPNISVIITGISGILLDLADLELTNDQLNELDQLLSKLKVFFLNDPKNYFISVDIMDCLWDIHLICRSFSEFTDADELEMMKKKLEQSTSSALEKIKRDLAVEIVLEDIKELHSKSINRL
jgi:hypothetical protein